MSDAHRFSDEELAAHVDGELEAARAAQLEAALATDPELAARHERQAAARRVLRRVFAEAPATPLPTALLDLFEPPVPAARAVSRHRWRSRRVWPMALAASLLLALGFGLWRQAPDAMLGRVLETAASGEPQQTAQGDLTALSTLQTASGQYCREYERNTATGRQLGLACREGEGRWRERERPESPATGGYEMASGEDDVAQSLGARRLDAGAERELLRQGWSGTTAP